jgi:FkbM family methyltransferase
MLAGQHIDVAEAEQYISPEDGVVLDFGAEQGEVSEHFLERGYAVHACEPARRNAAILRSVKGLHVHQVACSDQTGTGHLELSGSSWAHRLGRTVQRVRLVKLADLLREARIQLVALLKVDTEGHEPEVLKGLFQHCAVRPKLLMIEFVRESLSAILQCFPSDYRHFRVLARTNERPQETQIRLGVYDGLDPAIRNADWRNLLAAIRPFRTT